MVHRPADRVGFGNVEVQVGVVGIIISVQEQAFGACIGEPGITISDSVESGSLSTYRYIIKINAT